MILTMSRYMAAMRSRASEEGGGGGYLTFTPILFHLAPISLLFQCQFADHFVTSTIISACLLHSALFLPRVQQNHGAGEAYDPVAPQSGIWLKVTCQGHAQHFSTFSNTMIPVYPAYISTQCPQPILPSLTLPPNPTPPTSSLDLQRHHWSADE